VVIAAADATGHLAAGAVRVQLAVNVGRPGRVGAPPVDADDTALRRDRPCDSITVVP